jgi:hypothetical protein
MHNIPPTPDDIALHLRALSADMIRVGAAMEYLGGFGPMAERGIELVGAGRIALEWAEHIEGNTHYG